jgi:hypothetical protein
LSRTQLQAVYARLVRPPTARSLDILAFALPAVSFLEITIIGRLIVTELLLLVMLPWLWQARDRLPLPRWFLVLWAGWLLSQIATDIVVGSAFRDLARGWAGIVFTLTNFAGILVVVSTMRRARLFAVGLAIGGLLAFFFAPNPTAAFDPWKWGLAGPIGLLIAAGLSGRSGYRFPWLTVSMFVAFGTLNLVLGYRSLGGLSLLAAGYLGLCAVGRRPSAGPPSKVRALLGVAFLATVGVAVLGLYSAAASSGVLGPEAQVRYANQAGAFGVILGGRPEALVSTEAILDSPILGHGSWAKDPRYAKLLVDRQQELGYEVTPQYVGTDLIPAHSYLVGAWVWAGLFGALFWFAVASVAIWLLANLYAFRVTLAPLLVVQALLLLWELAFSPYGLGARITAPYALSLCLLGLRLLRKDREAYLSDLSSPHDCGANSQPMGPASLLRTVMSVKRDTGP